MTAQKRRLDLAAPEVRRARVHDRAAQVRLERLRLPKVPEAADRTQEGVLRDVLCQVGVARDQGRDPDGSRHVPHVEVLEVGPILHDGADDTGPLAHRYPDARASGLIAAACWYHARPKPISREGTDMAEQKLVAEKREGTGKGVARKLRAAGRIPGVLYGHGMDSTALSVDAKDLFHILHTGAGTNVLVDLVVDGSEHLIIPRDVQRDHIHGRFIHVDFLAVRRDEKLQLSIPVRVVGESVGVKAGGVVEHHLWELEVESLPGDVPEAIDADISALDIGMSLRVSDLVAPKGATILTNPDESVVAVQQPQMAVELEEEEAAEGEAVEGEAAEGEEGEAAGEGEGSGEAAERSEG